MSEQSNKLSLSKSLNENFDTSSDYHTCTIAKLVASIENSGYYNKFFLSPLQRKFVWPKEKIECLFDSIYNGIPIGTLYFVEIDNDSINQSDIYYKFNPEQKINKEQESQEYGDLNDSNVITVLDGQQRITSILIGVTRSGEYSERIPRTRAKSDRNHYYKLHFNFENESFKMLQSDHGEECYIPVADIFVMGNIELPNNYREHKSNPNILKLHEVLHEKQLISFWAKAISDVQDIELTERENLSLANLFINLNSGVALSPANLVFALLTSYGIGDNSKYAKGIRAKFEELSEEIHQTYLFNLDEMFLLSAFLYMLDYDNPNKIINGYKKNAAIVSPKDVLERILDEYDDLCESIKDVCKIANDRGLNNSTGYLKAKNTLLPVFFWAFDNPNIKIEDSANLIYQFLCIAHLNNAFSGRSFNNLEDVRKYIKSQESKIFPLRGIQDNNSIFKADVDTYLETDKNKSHFLLSVIQAQSTSTGTGVEVNVTADRGLDSDHLHPASPKEPLTENDFKDCEEFNKFRDFWEGNHNKLPNLALFDKIPNIRKSNKPLKEYLSELDKDQIHLLENFKRTRYLVNKDGDISNYLLTDFEKFYKARKVLLRKRLEEKLTQDERR
ncbi:hypothetical protein FACS1894125_4540 [Actinomycetota bacterium]|nr:hypothetical protein FACS1894125_4540 [Actinomycetota bacterium]